MKNSDIKYELSTDYERLYDLLKGGNVVVGFVGILLDCRMDKYSKIIEMEWNLIHGYFYIGYELYESDLKHGVKSFVKACRLQRIRYFDLKD